MPRNDPNSTTAIEDRLQHIGRYSRLVKAGLGVILTAFVLAVVVLLPANLDSAPSAVEAILLPLIFVGMALLLFGIGMHLHLMHLNLIVQLRKSLEETDVDEANPDEADVDETHLDDVDEPDA